MSRCLNQYLVSVTDLSVDTRHPCNSILVPVLCICMQAARGLAAITGDLVRRLVFRKKFSDTTTEPIVNM